MKYLKIVIIIMGLMIFFGTATIIYIVFGSLFLNHFYGNGYLLHINGNGGFFGNYLDKTFLNSIIQVNEIIFYYFLIFLIIIFF